jgi:hypothetical protein
MNEIDVIAMAADFVAGENGCSFSHCKGKAVESYVVDFRNDKGEMMHFSFPVCAECLRHINDKFSDWVPVLCVECAVGGWMLRNADVPDYAHAGFVDGCDDECTGVRKRGWWLGRDAFNC